MKLVSAFTRLGCAVSVLVTVAHFVEASDNPRDGRIPPSSARRFSDFPEDDLDQDFGAGFDYERSSEYGYPEDDDADDGSRNYYSDESDDGDYGEEDFRRRPAESNALMDSLSFGAGKEALYDAYNQLHTLAQVSIKHRKIYSILSAG